MGKGAVKGADVPEIKLNGSAIFDDPFTPVSTTLRRLLNHLPQMLGGRGDIYIKSSWHKPTPFDQWASQPPYRVSAALRTNHFGRVLLRQRIVRWSLRLGLIALAVWLVVESAHGLAML